MTYMMVNMCQPAWAIVSRYLDLLKHSGYFYESAFRCGLHLNHEVLSKTYYTP